MLLHRVGQGKPESASAGASRGINAAPWVNTAPEHCQPVQLPEIFDRTRFFDLPDGTLAPI
jgi:hypothetical protein